ncbi:MAG TPA: DUF475 domain-containing protein [Candidatus Microsaccharimonas sp.]|jgi:hypothetical protein
MGSTKGFVKHSVANIGGLLRHHIPEVIITLLVFAAVGIFMSPFAMVPLFILLVLEVSFSFDNAVVNAKVLERMSPRWQRAFLWIGLPIAVLGMRFVFPIGIVALTAQIQFGDVVTLAFNNASSYAEKLHEAHPYITMFGGVYLLLIFLDYFFEERDVKWLRPIENTLAKVGKLDNVSLFVAGLFVLFGSLLMGGEHMLGLLIAGVGSIMLYIGVGLISNIFDNEDDENAKKPVKFGVAAIGLFVYLEVQDSAFSFDGVSAAFAVTNSVVLIAAGLGIGALFVRSMTVQLVKTGTLSEFRYLEHGAHWAIGVLAICMLIGVGGIDIPDWAVGLIGVVFIIAAAIHSKRENKKEEALADFEQLHAGPVQEVGKEKVTV